MILDIGLGNGFLDMTLKAKIGKWYHTNEKKKKKKNFCTTKEIISKVKRRLTGWEKIFSNHMADKKLISKIYKKLL